MFVLHCWSRRPETDPAVILSIREAIDAGEQITTEILNYRKNGETFWNRLHLIPVATGAPRPLKDGAAADPAGGFSPARRRSDGLPARNGVTVFLGVQQEIPVHMADPRGTAEQAAQVANGMVQPVDYLGTQLSVLSEHQVRHREIESNTLCAGVGDFALVFLSLAFG
jgi:hypothetical protein